MKIMLINHYAGSEYYGMEFRPCYMARQWVKRGHEVVVVAADYSHLRKHNPKIDRDFTAEDIEGIKYLWVKTPAYHGNGAGRALNIAVFCYKLRANLKKLARTFAPEAVIASSTYPFDFYLAHRLAKLTAGRCYFEVHDLWPLTQTELYGMSLKNPYVKLLQSAEDFAFKNAVKVISVLPDAYKHMEERGFSKDKFVYIPNGIDLDVKHRPPEQSTHADVIKKLAFQGKFIVMYLGGFALANALEELVAASALVDEDVAVVLVGDGVMKPALMEQARRNGGNTLFLSGVPKDEVQGLLSLADCLYIGAKRCSLYRYGAGMNKLYDYMLAAKPVICGIEASNDIVSGVGCGVTIKPQDVKEIAGAIKSIKGLTDAQREVMGCNGYNYVVKNHDYAVLAQKFADSLKRE